MHVFTRIGAGQQPRARIDGVDYHRCPFDVHPDFGTETTNNMCNSFMHFLREAECHQNAAFDIVHGHDWLCAKGVVRAKNDFGRRTVITMHSTQFGRDGNQHFNGTCDRVRAVEWEGTYVADLVIAVSGALADELKWQYEVPEWKLRVAHNGIDCGRRPSRNRAGG